MDDFGELLSSVLSDPESMEKIKGIAQSLGMSTDGGQTVTPPEPVAIPLQTICKVGFRLE